VIVATSSHDANMALRIGIIGDTDDLLLVDEDGKGIVVGYDCEYVGCAEACVKRCDGWLVEFIAVKGSGAVTCVTDLKRIVTALEEFKVIVLAAIAAATERNTTAAIALSYCGKLHGDFIGEIGECVLLLYAFTWINNRCRYYIASANGLSTCTTIGNNCTLLPYALAISEWIIQD